VQLGHIKAGVHLNRHQGVIRDVIFTPGKRGAHIDVATVRDVDVAAENAEQRGVTHRRVILQNRR